MASTRIAMKFAGGNKSHDLETENRPLNPIDCHLPYMSVRGLMAQFILIR